MAKVVTQKFEHMPLSWETNTPGTYERVVGLTSGGISRSNNVQETEIPDADDESIPNYVEVAVNSLTVTISGAGVWAQAAHEEMLDWLYTGAEKNVRISHLNALVGDTEHEQGPAVLIDYNNERTKGERVSADLTIRFSGTPSRVAKAS